MRKQVSIKEGLFTWPAERPQLLGSRCDRCDEIGFRPQVDCCNCGGSDTRVIPIGDRGTLWTWTIQGFMPKQPYNSGETEETFTPYGVGYVEMPCGIRVEARLKENSAEQLNIGMLMQLVIEPFYEDEAGNEVMAFAFRRAE